MLLSYFYMRLSDIMTTIGQGVVLSNFYSNKCHKMLETLVSMVTHLVPGQNSHNIRFLQ